MSDTITETAPSGPQVLITGEAEKLPPHIRALEDPAQPLPAGVRYFEEKFSTGGLFKDGLLGLALGAVGIVVMAVAILWMFTRDHYAANADSASNQGMTVLIVGFVIAFAGYFTMTSLPLQYRTMRLQHRGADTRYGIFLADDLLIRHAISDTTVIPRPLFKGLSAGSVRYDLKGETKSYLLPRHLVRHDFEAMEAAILAWAGMGAATDR